MILRRLAAHPFFRDAFSAGQLGLLAGCMLVFVLPFTHTAALRNVALALAFGSAVVLWADGGRFTIPLAGVFGLWLGAACLSLAWAIDPVFSLKAIYSEIVRSAAAFFAAYVVARQSGDPRPWQWASIASLLLLAGLGLASFHGAGVWTERRFVPALGDFATTVVTAGPLALGLALFPAWRVPPRLLLTSLAVLAAAAAVYAGYLTQSRAFWVAMLAMVLGGSVATVFALGRLPRLALLLVAVSAAVIGVALKLVLQKRVQELTYIDDRAAIYSRSLERLLEHPWIGAGFGHESSRLWYVENSVLPGVVHPHNLLLSYGEQMGVWGVAVALFIFGAIGWAFVRRFRPTHVHITPLAVVGLVLVLGVFVVNSTNVFFVRHNQLLFFAHVGILLGCIDRLRQGKGARLDYSRKSSAPRPMAS